MKLRWKKLGRIFDPSEHQTSWMEHYAQNPNVLELNDRLRIYFTCRPKKDRSGNTVSLTAFADFEKEPPFKLIKVCDQPVLALGAAGTFDEFGIMPGSVIKLNETGEVWLYYVGWTRMSSVPYRWSNGLAISKDNGVSFKRYSPGPIMASIFEDCYLQACPRTIRLDKDRFIMWYNSGIEWCQNEGHFESVYITRFAQSVDGINWSVNNPQVIPTKVPRECQTSASFFQHNGRNHIFFSYRHGLDFRNRDNGYRIGYAYGENFTDFTRADELSDLTISETGWDSEMVCYPHVTKINGKTYLFYCGNNFGQFGFGVAELEG
jgi:hypothetical protein